MAKKQEQTQRDKVLKHLQHYGYIDMAYAARVLDIYYLFSVIRQLKKLGYKITTEKVKVDKKRPRLRYKLAKSQQQLIANTQQYKDEMEVVPVLELKV